jgi:hypothetical protein
MVIVLLVLTADSGALLAAESRPPRDIPTLYEDDPYNEILRRKAKHRVKLTNCVVAEQGGINGYFLKYGVKRFVILNQNPDWLKDLEYYGKPVTVEGRVSDTYKSYYDLYFIVIDKIDGRPYDGKVGPLLERQPTKAEVQYWRDHGQLPPATQKMLDYLSP